MGMATPEHFREGWEYVYEVNNFGVELRLDSHLVRVVSVKMDAKPTSFAGPVFIVSRLHDTGNQVRRCSASELMVGDHGVPLSQCLTMQRFGWKREGSNWRRLNNLERLGV